MFIYQRVQHITTQLHIENPQPYELKTTRPCGPPNHISPLYIHVPNFTIFRHCHWYHNIIRFLASIALNPKKKYICIVCFLLRFFGILWLGIVFYLCCQNSQVLNYLRNVRFSSCHMSLDHFLLGQDPDLPGLPMSVMMMMMMMVMTMTKTMTMGTLLIMMMLMLMMMMMMMMAWLIGNRSMGVFDWLMFRGGGTFQNVMC